MATGVPHLTERLRNESRRNNSLIEKEINGNWNISNDHGVDLRRCLVTPEMKIFTDPFKYRVELWLVLEEYPETRAGYKIVFDESCMKFGLVTSVKDSDLDLFLGINGSFLETLEAM